MDATTIIKPVKNYLLSKLLGDILNPVDGIIDKNLSEVSTTIGAFIIREIKGKFVRQISFTIGINYSDSWMEEALYGVLYKYNKLDRVSSNLELTNKNGYSNGSMMYARLGDGAHNLKYRKWRIVLGIATSNQTSVTGRSRPVRTYVIMTTSMDPEFVDCLKNDLIEHRDAILKINSKGKYVNVYKDYPDGGDVYWEQCPPGKKRLISTIYLPREQMEFLVNSINTFFADRAEYEKRGVPWNLKILFYGQPGSGKSSLARMIASEWGRNLYEINGGKTGKYIPKALECDDNDAVRNPVFVINDLDRFPQLISEAKLEISKKDDATEERLEQRQVFRRFLNALDGSSTSEGRIVIATANDISQFSPVLLRDGRFDIIMEIGGVVEETFRKYVWDVYGREIPGPFYLCSDDITIGKLNRDTLIKKLSYEEFMAKYTQSTPPIKKAPAEKPKVEKISEPEVKEEKPAKKPKILKKDVVG